MAPPRLPFFLRPLPCVLFLLFVPVTRLRTADLSHGHTCSRSSHHQFRCAGGRICSTGRPQCNIRQPARFYRSLPDLSPGGEGILKRLIKVSGEGTNELKIVTDIPRSIANWGRAEYPIDFEVVVPPGVPLQLRDTSGIIRISQVNAPVEVHDGSGTLTISDVHGAVTVAKDSGDIQVDRVGDVTRITSKTGPMRLHDLAQLQIEESDGNLEIVNTGQARVHNKGGNLRVSNVKGDLEIEDESGEIQVSDGEGNVKIRDTSGQIRVSHARGVVIDDTDGDITVRQAASLCVRQKESGQVKVSTISGSVEFPSRIQLHRE